MQTACEMWCLLRTFPLMIGSAVPIENSVWELYILFVQLLERLCAPSFNNEELSVLNYLIKEFYVSIQSYFLRHHLNQKLTF